MLGRFQRLKKKKESEKPNDKKSIGRFGISVVG